MMNEVAEIQKYKLPTIRSEQRTMFLSKVENFYQTCMGIAHCFVFWKNYFRRCGYEQIQLFYFQLILHKLKNLSKRTDYKQIFK